MLNRFCNCRWDEEDGHEFHCSMSGNNTPGSRVQASIFRNAYIGDIEKVVDWVVLDQYGVHATWIHTDWFDEDGKPVVEELTRLNQRLSYSFDAPSTLCPIRAKLLHCWEIRYEDRAAWKKMEQEHAIWLTTYEKALKVARLRSYSEKGF